MSQVPYRKAQPLSYFPNIPHCLDQDLERLAESKKVLSIIYGFLYFAFMTYQGLGSEYVLPCWSMVSVTATQFYHYCVKAVVD